MIEESSPFARSSKSFYNKVGRSLWYFVWLLLFRPTPKVFWKWRNLLLKVFGAKIGKGSKIHPSAKISEPWFLVLGDYVCVGPYVICYSSGGIEIQSYATISQYAYLCSASHDYTKHAMPLIMKPVKIEKQAWICADAFIGLGVTIGQGAVVGARAVVAKDVEPWNIVAGNPARFIKNRKVDKIL